jgi:hypothetical protein
MSKLDISTATAEAIVLMENLRERLAGHDVSVIGAALGEMVATYIASFSPEMRDETRTILLAFVDEMVPFVDGHDQQGPRAGILDEDRFIR